MNPSDLSRAQLTKIGFLARKQRGNFINGAEVMPASGQFVDVIDPATEMVVAQAPDSNAAEDQLCDRHAKERGPKASK